MNGWHLSLLILLAATVGAFCYELRLDRPRVKRGPVSPAVRLYTRGLFVLIGLCLMGLWLT